MYNDVIQLPGYLSAMTDHWGYYNGIPLNINSYDFYEYYHTYKTPSSSHMQAGVLNRIVYPTGAMTKFEYEPHEYIWEANNFAYNAPLKLMNPSIAGGLRIRAIVDYADQSGAPDKVLIVREYFYVE